MSDDLLADNLAGLFRGISSGEYSREEIMNNNNKAIVCYNDW